MKEKALVILVIICQNISFVFSGTNIIVGKNASEDGLKALAQTALQQIETQKYDTDMNTRGVKSILKYGVAFSGKQVEIVKA